MQPRTARALRGCRTSCRNPAAALRLPAPPQDKVAEHQDSDEFTHHVHAPMVEAVNELTTAAIDAEFGSPKPRYEALAKSLAAKVRARVGRGCRNPSGRAPAVRSGSQLQQGGVAALLGVAGQVPIGVCPRAVHGRGAVRCTGGTVR